MSARLLCPTCGGARLHVDAPRLLLHCADCECDSALPPPRPPVITELPAPWRPPTGRLPDAVGYVTAYVVAYAVALTLLRVAAAAEAPDDSPRRASHRPDREDSA